jgi:hypothetical protein
MIKGCVFVIGGVRFCNMMEGCVSVIGGRGGILQYDRGVCFCNRRKG